MSTLVNHGEVPSNNHLPGSLLSIRRLVKLWRHHGWYRPPLPLGKADQLSNVSACSNLLPGRWQMRFKWLRLLVDSILVVSYVMYILGFELTLQKYPCGQGHLRCLWYLGWITVQSTGWDSPWQMEQSVCTLTIPRVAS